MDRAAELKSLKRGLRALVLLSDHRSLTISEAARLLGLPRTTAERIMVTLEHEAFISRLPDSKRYALAPRVLAVAEGYSAEDRLIGVGSPLLFEKTREIGWPLALATAIGDRMSVRVTTDGATSLGLHKRHIGSEIAMAQASSGIVHLAYLEPAEREEQIQLLAASETPVQPYARDRPRLDALIAETRRVGFSIDPGVGPEWALSVPIFDQGRIRGVLVMMYMTRGISFEKLVAKYVPQVKDLASEIALQAFGAPSEAATSK